MARSVDFQRLYTEFGLAPGASIDELKLAYRRRVSVLHPDRMSAGDRISQHLANDHLTRLTALYEAAEQFHRRHGRLPGAAVTGRQENFDPPPAHFTALDDPLVVPGRGRAFAWLLPVLPVLLIAWLVYALDATDHPEPAAEAPVVAAPIGVPQPRQVRAERSTDGIRVGMSGADVVRIQGEPMARDGARWDYGPSWIRFNDGQVEEWYSSPLRSLRIARTPAPPAPVEPAASGDSK